MVEPTGEADDGIEMERRRGVAAVTVNLDLDMAAACPGCVCVCVCVGRRRDMMRTLHVIWVHYTSYGLR